MVLESYNGDNTLKESVDDVIKRTSSLREVTYKYVPWGEDKFLNETICAEYAEIGNTDSFALYIQEIASHDQEAFLKIKTKIEEKLTVDISVLKEYLDECEENERPNITQLIAALEFTFNALDFELELAGYEHGLSDEEIQTKIVKQEALDELMFGEHVSKNPDFILESYVYTKNLLDNNGDQLSDNQLKILNDSQQVMLHKVAELKGISVDEIVLPVYVEPEKDSNFEKLSKIEIQQDDMVRILDMMFEVSGVPQRSKIGEYAGFYDADDYFGVPKGYTSKTLEEILRIGSHEAYHYISLGVTNDRGNVKQAGDMVNDEGNAMYTEALVSGVNTQKCSYMTFAGPSVVMNKLFSGNKYTQYQDAYLELLEKSNVSAKGNVIQKTLRKKRGFHKSYAGGTNKDAAYALGMKSTLEFMRSENASVKNLFSGKVSTEQMKSGEFIPEDFGNRFINNILLSEIIIYYLQNKEKESFGLGGIHDGFVTYLREKYKHLSDSFHLFDEAERFCMRNKMKVGRILKIIEQSKDVDE